MGRVGARQGAAGRRRGHAAAPGERGARLAAREGARARRRARRGALRRPDRGRGRARARARPARRPRRTSASCARRSGRRSRSSPSRPAPRSSTCRTCSRPTSSCAGRARAFPVEEIAAAVAARLGEAGTALAARLPVLREPVCDALIERFSRQNGIIGVAVFLPGADFAVLTLNQIRLVLRLAAAHGVEIDQSRAARGAGDDRRRVRVPRRRAAGARRGPGRRLGRQGRDRLRRHARARRGSAPLLPRARWRAAP